MTRRIFVLRSSVRWAVLAAAAGLAAAGCGPIQMGAAAVVGSGRISDSTLAGQVARLNTAYQADKGSAQITYHPSQLPLLALSWLVRFRIRDDLAVRQHISVTPAEAGVALQQIAINVQQSGGKLSVAATGAGLPPDLLTALGRYVAIQTKLENRIDGGVTPTTQAQSTAITNRFNHLECLAAKSLHIRISPQYGAFNYAQFSIVPIASTLAAGPAGPVRTPRSQLTPHC